MANGVRRSIGYGFRARGIQATAGCRRRCGFDAMLHPRWLTREQSGNLFQAVIAKPLVLQEYLVDDDAIGRRHRGGNPHAPSLVRPWVALVLLRGSCLVGVARATTAPPVWAFVVWPRCASATAPRARTPPRGRKAPAPQPATGHCGDLPAVHATPENLRRFASSWNDDR